MSDLVELVREPIAPAAFAAAEPCDGAVCLFVGVVRDNNAGRTVLGLEYEAYEEMALPLMREIAEETRRLHPATSIRLVHRLGRLAVGEASVVAVATSPHRAEAFAACRFVIDAMKARVPIWKKELYADGAAWVEGRGNCAPQP
jgi:molybdopterin synthase catalytic subunit